jgi:sec-independent protein translocase protein TatB
MTTEVRKQTGIDDILRAEGLSGGIQELRSLVRGEVAPPAQRGAAMRAAPRHEPDAVVDAYGEALELDRYREFPVEGPDAYGAIPEDLAAALAPEPTRPDAVPAAAPAPVPAAAPSPGPDPAPGGPGPAAPPPRPTSGAGAAEAKEPA